MHGRGRVIALRQPNENDPNGVIWRIDALRDGAEYSSDGNSTAEKIQTCVSAAAGDVELDI